MKAEGLLGEQLYAVIEYCSNPSTAWAKIESGQYERRGAKDKRFVFDRLPGPAVSEEPEYCPCQCRRRNLCGVARTGRYAEPSRLHVRRGRPEPRTMN